MFIKYEELLLNSKPAAFTTLYEGLIINYAGINQFTKSIHPLYDRRNNIHERIASVEAILANYNQIPEYRIVFQKDYQEFDEELFRNGYERSGHGTVKMIDIKPLQNELFTFANFIQNGVFIEEEIKDFWLDDFSYLMNYSQVEDKIFRDSIKRLIVPCSTFTLIEENTLIGQAYATFQENYMIINSVVINKKTRNLSYGKRLLMSMLSYGLKRGAEIAIADVDYLDTAGNKLFDKVKFEDIYGYCYRIKRITK